MHPFQQFRYLKLIDESNDSSIEMHMQILENMFVFVVFYKKMIAFFNFFDILSRILQLLKLLIIWLQILEFFKKVGVFKK